MKKIFALIFINLLLIPSVFAEWETIKTKSNTTDSESSSYYDNNLKENKLFQSLTPAQQSFVENKMTSANYVDKNWVLTKEWIEKFWGEDDWKCGNKCMASLTKELKKISDDFELDKFYNKNNYFKVEHSGAWAIKNVLLTIARDFKLVIYWIIWVLVLYMTMMLFISEKTEDQMKKYRKWIIWISVWVVIMQTAFSLTSLNVSSWWTIQERLWALGSDVQWLLIDPFINLVEFWAMLLFLFTWIWAFYKLISNWSDDSKAKEAKQSIAYAIIWFVILKITKPLIQNTYSVNCVKANWSIIWSDIKTCGEITKNVELLVKVLTKINSFVWIFVIFSIIYTWFLLITSRWDEEKLKKAKKNILFISIWITILFASYLIMNFFINQQ